MSMTQAEPATTLAQLQETKPFDSVLALEVLEHFKSPEKGAREIFEQMQAGGKLYASTGNVAFIVTRLMLLLGKFNYGRRGILDLTHTRLFTRKSFERLLKNAGFRIDKVTYFGPPIEDLEPDSRYFRAGSTIFRKDARPPSSAIRANAGSNGNPSCTR